MKARTNSSLNAVSVDKLVIISCIDIFLARNTQQYTYTPHKTLKFFLLTVKCFSQRSKYVCIALGGRDRESRNILRCPHRCTVQLSASPVDPRGRNYKRTINLEQVTVEYQHYTRLESCTSARAYFLFEQYS